MKALTKNQEQLRELWFNQSLATLGDGDELIEKMRSEDGMSWSEVDEFVDLIESEYQTGVYRFPPPMITKENAHLHMCEPDDSWMFA